MKILSLFDESGIMVRPWVEAGVECTIVDALHPPGVTEGNPRRIGADLMTWVPDQHYDVIFAFPPCTYLCRPASQHWPTYGGRSAAVQMGMELVKRTLEIISLNAPMFWLIENPTGQIPKMWRKWDFKFNPGEFGGWINPPIEAYTKETCLWFSPSFPTLERREAPRPWKRHYDWIAEVKKTGYIKRGQSVATDRSKTPAGFSYAVFHALYPVLLERVGGRRVGAKKRPLAAVGKVEALPLLNDLQKAKTMRVRDLIMDQIREAVLYNEMSGKEYYEALQVCPPAGATAVQGRKAPKSRVGAFFTEVRIPGINALERVSNAEVILSEKSTRLFVADCAEHVSSIYYAAMPSGSAPRRAIEAARLFARGGKVKVTDYILPAQQAAEDVMVQSWSAAMAARAAANTCNAFKADLRVASTYAGWARNSFDNPGDNVDEPDSKEYQWQEAKIKEYLQLEAQDAILHDQNEGFEPLTGLEEYVAFATILRRMSRNLFKKLPQKLPPKQRILRFECGNDFSSELDATFWVKAFVKKFPRSPTALEALANVAWQEDPDKVLQAWKTIQPKPETEWSPDDVRGRTVRRRKDITLPSYLPGRKPAVKGLPSASKAILPRKGHRVSGTPKLGPLGGELMRLRRSMAKAAQKVYDDWDQDEEGADCELGSGGICDRVSSALWGAIDDHIKKGVEYQIREGGQEGDNHSWLIVYNDAEMYEVDIPLHIYESGSGYSWQKIPGVKFRAEDVIVHPLNRDDFRGDAYGFDV